MFLISAFEEDYGYLHFKYIGVLSAFLLRVCGWLVDWIIVAVDLHNGVFERLWRR